MAQSDAGRVIILPKGEYSATANYEILDLVTYASSTWLCKQSCIGITPTEGAYWMLFGSAAQIATGDTVGLVKPDGTTITIDADGTIHGAGGDAEDISFDPPEGMEADNVQDALTEEFGTITDHEERIEALEEGGTTTALEEWLNKGNITTKYSTLADVLASQSTINQLMRIHASVDYLITWSATDSSIISTICGNANAMGAIGEYDYASDKLLAVTAWKTAILASAYMESVFKDHVPKMTSNTSPRGVASASSIYSSSYDAYKAFDGTTSQWASTTSGSAYLQYKFESPILVKRVKHTNGHPNATYSGIVKASNDGTNWSTLSASTTFQFASTTTIDLSNENYYLYYRIDFSASASDYTFNTSCLQFLGRKMSIYVPNMTSNTTPRGEVSASSYQSTTPPYKVFGGGNWVTADSETSGWWLQYDFGKEVKANLVSLKTGTTGGTSQNSGFIVKGSNNGTDFVNITSEITLPYNTLVSSSFANTNAYRYYRISFTKSYRADANQINLSYAQIYGSDYSESIRATDVVLSDGTSVEDALMGGGDVGLFKTAKANVTYTNVTITNANRNFYCRSGNIITLFFQFNATISAGASITILSNLLTLFGVSNSAMSFAPIYTSGGKTLMAGSDGNNITISNRGSAVSNEAIYGQLTIYVED